MTADSELYQRSCKPALGSLLKALKLDIAFTRAEGDRLYYRGPSGEECSVLDAVGGYGSTLLGHNHPRIKAAAIEFLQANIVFHGQGSVRSGAAQLAKEINDLLEDMGAGGDDSLVHLVNSGTEATEAALQMILLLWRARSQLAANWQEEPAEPVVFSLKRAYHGKSAGALALCGKSEYRSIFAQQAVQTSTLDPDSDRDLESIFSAYDLPAAQLDLSSEIRPAGAMHWEKVPLRSRVAGVFLEMIQGEAGVYPLPVEWVKSLTEICRRRSIPLVVDEIQTGLYRCGKAFACQDYGIIPDLMLLGKGLGGGIAKIAALVCRRPWYFERFSIVHSSTFAEDDFSSMIGVQTLKVLRQEKGSILSRAQECEEGFGRRLAACAEEFPTCVSEVRGAGFMWAVQFRVGNIGTTFPFLEALQTSGSIGPFLASYLFHRHGVRVAPTLNQNQTLRIQPSYLMGDTDWDRIIEAFRDLFAKLERGQFAALCAHLWGGADPLLLERRSPSRPSWSPSKRARAVFLSHLIHPRQLGSYDSVFAPLEDPFYKDVVRTIAVQGTHLHYHRQVIRAADGRELDLDLYAIPTCTRFFEESLRNQDQEASALVRLLYKAALQEPAVCVGLGQLTSAVCDAGLGLEPRAGTVITSGNALTVAYALEAAATLMEKQGRQLSCATVGVVGAAGNIGSVIAEWLFPRVKSLVLMHRSELQHSLKFQGALQRILQSGESAAQLSTVVDARQLRTCDLVFIAVNTCDDFLYQEAFKPGALVVDVSVPLAISDKLAQLRSDVAFYRGGLARFPDQQILRSSFIPAPRGQTFACLAETIATALSGATQSASYGRLSLANIHAARQMAEQVGFSCGSALRFKGISEKKRSPHMHAAEGVLSPL